MSVRRADGTASAPFPAKSRPQPRDRRRALKARFWRIVQQMRLDRYLRWGRRVFLGERNFRITMKTVPAEFRRALEDLGPTFVKFGQVLSTRPDLIPPSVTSTSFRACRNTSARSLPSRSWVHRTGVGPTSRGTVCASSIPVPQAVGVAGAGPQRREVTKAAGWRSRSAGPTSSARSSGTCP